LRLNPEMLNGGFVNGRNGGWATLSDNCCYFLLRLGNSPSRYDTISYW